MVGISDRLTDSGATPGMETTLEGVRADGGHRMDFKRWGKRGRKCVSKK